MGWRPSKTAGETLRKRVIVRQFSRANNGIPAGADPELDTMNTENNSEMKTEAEEWKLHRMAKVHHFLKMWQGSQILPATQKESPAQNKQITAVGYISDTEEIVIASWSLLQHDGVAAFKLLERSLWPPPLSTKDLPRGRTQILNVRWIQRINHHLVECDEDTAAESILDTEDWRNRNGDSDNPNYSEDHCGSVVESDMDHNNNIEDPECLEQQDVGAAPNVPGLIRPTPKSNTQGDTVFLTFNAIETRRIQGVKKK